MRRKKTKTFLPMGTGTDSRAEKENTYIHSNYSPLVIHEPNHICIYANIEESHAGSLFERGLFTADAMVLCGGEKTVATRTLRVGKSSLEYIRRLLRPNPCTFSFRGAAMWINHILNVRRHACPEQDCW